MFDWKKGFFWSKLALLIVSVLLLTKKDESVSITDLHKFYLENSPYKQTIRLSKQERFKEGLPPNQFYEQLYSLTMDPSTGVPDYAAKQQLQYTLEEEKNNPFKIGAVPGESASTPWYNIGPNNQAGRTRAALFDNADTEKDRVFAGGVSGGLWLNEDIDNPVDQDWSMITGVPGNLAVSNIVQDPGDDNIMFVGTGESYTSGDATGNGIYKSTDRGQNWSLVFGSSTGLATSTFSNPYYWVDGYFYVNDLAFFDHDKDPSTTNWIYAALGNSTHSKMSNALLDYDKYGLYVSKDSGSSWTQITTGLYYQDGAQREGINDIDVQAVSNRIWLATTTGNGTRGGTFYYSDDGDNFTRASPSYTTTPTDITRTEIAPSATNTDTHYVLMRANRVPEIYKTTDNFASLQKLPEPNDADNSISATDFTRNQSFYDLEIEVDPTNDDIVYVGGINWHRSQNGGQDWSQITKWSDNPSMNVLNISKVHADQHGLYFRPGNSNQAVVVSDGGVAYSSSLSTASSTASFNEIEGNYVTTQFYRVAQTPPSFPGNDMIFGGTQDNGTYRFDSPGINLMGASEELPGGDGAATFFDQVPQAGGSYAITNYVYNNAVTRIRFNASGTRIGADNLSNSLGFSSANEGSFINPGVLDSNQDVYYSNAGSGNIRSIRNLSGAASTFLLSGLGDDATALEVSPHTVSSTLLLVGLEDGNIEKVTNANTNGFTVSTLTKPGEGSVSDIHFGDTDQKIYVTYYNYGQDIVNVYYSEDGGTSWINKEGNDGVNDLPDIPVYTILNNPYEEDEVIVGTELGIWKTLNFTDTHPDWSVAYEGMSDVAVFDMVFRGVSATDNRVVAGTFGRGVYVGSFTANSNPPVTNTDSITLAEGGTATTTTAGATSVLANDTDPDGDALTADFTQNPINVDGPNWAFSSTGSFTYTHDGSETTTDTFFYRAFDGTTYGDTVTVTINITPVNDCPTVSNAIADFTAMEDDPDTVIDLSNTFDDVDNAIITITNVTNANTALLTATLNTNTLTLDYIDDQTGVATITIDASDGSCTEQEVFVVTVVPQNDAPVGSPDFINVFEAGTATTTTANNSSVLTDDTDMENDPLTATLVPGSGPYHHLGSFSLQSSGTFVYIHDGSETTTDTFFYTLSDGLSSTNVTVTININPVNDCPNTATPTLDLTVDEDDPDTVINLNNVFNDVDVLPMPNNLTYTVTHTNASLATVTLNTATLTIDYKDDQNGSMVVTVTTDDNAGCNTTTDAFNITVNSVNDIPNTATDTIQVDEGGTATTTTANNSSLLDNDIDNDGPNPIEMQLVNMPQFGTLAWSGTGTFTYVHDSSETTTDSFSYRTYDGQDQGNTVIVSINIIPINDCPQNTVFRDTTINEDGAGFGYPIATSDTTDPDNAYPLASYTVTYTNASLATVTFDPAVGDPSFAPKLNQNGTMTGTVTISDGDPSCTLEVPFRVTILPVNDCPVVDNPIADVSVVEDAADQWIDIQNTFSDIESPTLNYTVTSNDPSIVAASLTSTSIILDFQDNAYGSATIIITARDGSPTCTTDDIFDVTISPINDGPTTNPEVISVASGNTVTTLNDRLTTSVLDNDTDPENDPITAQLVTTTINGSLTLNSNGTFSYTHDGSATSTDTFYYRATDGFIAGNTVSVTIYINNPPVAVTETIAVLEAGTATALNDGVTTSLLANDTDADGDALTAVLVTNPTEGTLTLNSNGTFSYAHGGGNLSSDSFTYSANDGKINGAPVTVSITVTGTNDPPVANDDNIIVPLNGTVTTLDNGQNSLLANDSDPDGDALTATLVTSPSFGTITLNPGGTFSYTQNGTLNAGDSFTYTVTDGTLTSSSATVNILLSCTPCTESIIEGGVNGVSFTYTDCLCKTVRVYVPKGKAYTFCHLDNSISVNAGNYTLITSKACN